MVRKISVSGNYFQCGQQVGEQCRNSVMELIDSTKDLVCKDSLYGGDWSRAVLASREYFEISRKELPDLVDELLGVAKGANITFDDLWASIVEEIYLSPIRNCTDVVYDPTLTGKSYLVGHNNDMDAISERRFATLVEWNIKGFGRLVTMGGSGFYVGAGINEYGVVLTGNALTPNDSKQGIPRYLMARSILNQKNFDSALSVAMSPLRANSYNNIILSKGRCVSVEASATDFSLLAPFQGMLVHTNHYVDDKMKKYEGLDPQGDSYTSSVKRYEAVLKSKGKSIKEILATHNEGKTNNSVCRHSQDVKTVYSFVYDLENNYFEFASGNPCENPYEKVFLSW